MTIELADLRFFGYHGVMDQEAQVGNEFKVDLELVIDATPLEKMVADRQEALERTISYADIFEVIKAEMVTRRELLETLAIAITDRIVSRWPQTLALKIRILKIAPPIPGCNGQAGVSYNWTKEDWKSQIAGIFNIKRF